MDITVSYFEESGRDNTRATLACARKRADELGITQVVLASSHGYTGLEAAKTFAGTGTRIVAVTLSGAFAAEGPSALKLAPFRALPLSTPSMGALRLTGKRTSSQSAAIRSGRLPWRRTEGLSAARSRALIAEGRRRG